jgi:hypothetical protein
MGWLVDIYYALASILNVLLLYDRYKAHYRSMRPHDAGRCRHCGAVLADVEVHKDKTN